MVNVVERKYEVSENGNTREKYFKFAWFQPCLTGCFFPRCPSNIKVQSEILKYLLVRFTVYEAQFLALHFCVYTDKKAVRRTESSVRRSVFPDIETNLAEDDF